MQTTAERRAQAQLAVQRAQLRALPQPQRPPSPSARLIVKVIDPRWPGISFSMNWAGTLKALFFTVASALTAIAAARGLDWLAAPDAAAEPARAASPFLPAFDAAPSCVAVPHTAATLDGTRPMVLDGLLGTPLTPPRRTPTTVGEPSWLPADLLSPELLGRDDVDRPEVRVGVTPLAHPSLTVVCPLPGRCASA